MDVMYEIPSRSDVKKCVISGDTIRNRQRPLLLTRSGANIELSDEAAEDAEEDVKDVSA
jgi:ATP-dependent Clp protease ATP-binding subunit ClpX